MVIDSDRRLGDVSAAFAGLHHQDEHGLHPRTDHAFENIAEEVPLFVASDPMGIGRMRGSNRLSISQPCPDDSDAIKVFRVVRQAIDCMFCIVIFLRFVRQVRRSKDNIRQGI